MDLVAHNRAAYNAIAPHFSKTRSRLWSEFNEFTSFLRPGQRVLDWGCGNGRLIFMLDKMPCEYYGVDQSAEIIKQAEELHAKAIAAGWAHFFCTENGEKIFDAEFFDLVFMMASFFHLPDKTTRQALLKKTWTELKPGGRLCMTLWNLGSDWANQKKTHWKEIAPNDFLIPWKNQAGKVIADRYYHHFTPEEITGLLTQAGFKLESINYSTGTWRDDKGGRNMIVVAQKI